MLSFFPRGVLDEILNLIESVSEGFPSYSSLGPYLFLAKSKGCDRAMQRRRNQNLRLPQWLTFHFHIISQLRTLNSELRIPRNSYYEFRNSEVYVMWASGNSYSTLEGILNLQTKPKGSMT